MLFHLYNINGKIVQIDNKEALVILFGYASISLESAELNFYKLYEMRICLLIIVFCCALLVLRC